MGRARQKNKALPTSEPASEFQDFTAEGFISAEERDRWIDSFADRVVRLKLQSLVEFLLESHLPATTLLYSAGLFVQPLLTPFVRPGRIERLQAILADRSQVEILLRRIRQRSEAERHQRND